MKTSLNIAFFGSSLVSAYWNGAATYYRGIVRALSERGHTITFYEPDAYGRQQNRDIPDPDWAKVIVYAADSADNVRKTVELARGVDLVIKASGVGVFDELLEEAVLELQNSATRVIFWDVDAPATLDRITHNAKDAFRALIPRYDFVLTYGGGDPVVEAYERFGARKCVPIYNALDPHTHYPVPPEPRFESDLGFLGNRLPDRELRVEEFFLNVATLLPERRFLLGGSGWADKPKAPNVTYVGHVYTRDHNAFNSTPMAVLNVNRESMARYGFSPPTRVFEAAGAGACLITDAWVGIELFLEPGKEVLVAHNAEEVAAHLQALTPERARRIGDAALTRIRAEHTYQHRVVQLEAILDETESRSVAANEEAAVEVMRIVIIGLSITSSWGNGHATTYRGLVRELAARGHEVLFLERDVPWYAENRDAPQPPYVEIGLYQTLNELRRQYQRAVADADAVIVGSYVPEGIEVGDWVLDTAKAAVAFYDIDTPVTLGKLKRGECDYLSPELIRHYDLYLSFTGGPTLRKLEDELGSPMARALYCAVDPRLYFPETVAMKWDLGYIGTYSPDRQPTLDKLLIAPAQRWSDGNFVVAGPQYPKDIRWPKNVERVEHLSPAEHRHFYRQQRFTLNVTRADMIAAGYSPSVRLFEAAACGTPIISDHWEGLDTLFSIGTEIFVAHSTEEMLHRLQETSPDRAEEMGYAARRRVLSQHTAAHRAAELEGYLREALHQNDPRATHRLSA